MNRVLAVRGRVVPATGTVITLYARLDDGSQVAGPEPDREDQPGRPRVGHARGRPATATPSRPSPMPSSSSSAREPVHQHPAGARGAGIREAIAASGALVVFVCNVATQPGETGGFDLADHVDALARHGAATCRTSCSPTTGSTRTRRRAGSASPCAPWPSTDGSGPRLVLDDLVDPGNAHHHDSERLAAALIRAWEGEGGHRRRPSVARAASAASLTGRPERAPMSGSDRDLVAALRAELSAVDASRPCDRRAEIAGLGPRVRTREPAVARLVVRLGGGVDGRSLARATHAHRGLTGRSGPPGVLLPEEPFDWAGAAEHCRSRGCAAGTSPAAR